MASAMKPQYTEIVKMYSRLKGRWQMWELWQDSMTMFACAVSNQVDHRFRDKREEMYMDIVKKYEKDELAVFPQIFAEIVRQLERDPEQDFLGDLYMTLGLGSHWHGQFFTPYTVCCAMCRAMAAMNFSEITDPADVKPITVNDSACGGGATLIAAAHEYRRCIAKTGLNPQNYICFYAQDISTVAALMCYIQLSLQGYAAKIKIGDTLLNPLVAADNGADIWYTPMWFSDVWTVRRMIRALSRKDDSN